MKRIINNISGILIGLINILIGSCGGIVAVETLKHTLNDQTKAHATAIAVILPLTVISAGIYVCNGSIKISDSFIFLIPGLIGSILGSKLLTKIPQNTLSKIFSCFMIYSGVRMFLR